MDSELITLEGVSRRSSIPSKTLVNWRLSGRGPKYLKIGARVLYRISDVDEWLRSCERGTREQPAADQAA